MVATSMQLKVVLPSKVFLEHGSVRRIVVETPSGSYGLLPQRLDCVSAVATGILTYEIAMGEEVYVAHDEGVLIKHGRQVLISVRSAFTGTDLRLMHDEISEQFLKQGEEESAQRRLETRLENGFLRRFAEFRNE